MFLKNKTRPISTPDGITDEMVIDNIRQGSINDYEIIMRRYNQQMFRIARSILGDDDSAQDAMQQAYISAFYNLDSYIPHGCFAAWLSRITLNESLMIKRKPDNRKRAMDINYINDNLTTTENEPSSVYANQELATLIEHAIDDLPQDFRLVFILRSIQQLSTQETAASLDINGR